MYKPVLFILQMLLAAVVVRGQSYYSHHSRPLADHAAVYDTIHVSALSAPVLNTFFGLNSVSLDIDCFQTANLVVSVIAPDGTTVHLAEQAATGPFGNHNFSGTIFTMDAKLFLTDVGAPFEGPVLPDNSLGNVNNGQSGNGNWQLRVLNKGIAGEAHIKSWALHFNNKPAKFLLDSSDLPIVVINTGNVSIPHLNWYPEPKQKIEGSFSVIFNGPGKINRPEDSSIYQGNVVIKTRGNTSRYFQQKSYTLEMKDAEWKDKDIALLDMPAEEDWVLIATWCDRSLTRDALTYRLANDMGRYAPRTRFCELVLNGDYKGVYVLAEKIKRDNDRVDISKMNEDDVSGGYIIQVDRRTEDETEGFASTLQHCPRSSVFMKYEYPKADEITAGQKQYITAYIDSFERSLPGPGRSPAYNNYIDVASFIDFFLVQEVANNVDAYRLSSYMHKKKDGKLVAGPVWDFNLAYGNVSLDEAHASTGFRWSRPCEVVADGCAIPLWWPLLMQHGLFSEELKSRYTHLRETVFSKHHTEQLIDSLTGALADAQERHFLRWPILGRDVFFSSDVRDTWEEEVSKLKDWLGKRLEYMDTELSTYRDIDVHPNPASSQVEASTIGVIKEISISDLAGKRLLSKRCSEKDVMIDISELPAGIYLLSAKTSTGEVYSKKVIKK